MFQKKYQRYERLIGPNGTNLNPLVSSTKLSDVKDYFDTNVILGKELSLFYKNDENLKKGVDKSEGKGYREYYVFESILSHQMWQGCKPDDYYFNEYARGKDDVRLVLDYDIKKTDDYSFKWDEDVKEDSLEVIKECMDCLRKLINPDDPDDIVYDIWGCCREDKISYHIIFRDVSIKFKNIPSLIKHFLDKLKLKDGDKPYIFKKNGESWFDMNIYPASDESTKSLRLPYHAKRCNNIKLMKVYGTSKPEDQYIKHFSNLDYVIEEIGSFLMIGRMVLCDLDKKFIPKPKDKIKFDVSADPDQISEVLSHLCEERRQYDYRINVMFAIYNTFGEDGKEMFLKFAREGEKDREGKALNNWTSINPNTESKVSLGTIFWYLKEDDPDYYVEYFRNIRKNPKRLFHDIGFMDITYDTLYKELSTKVFTVDKTDENELNHIDELGDAMSDIFYKIKACIAMFKTPQTYFRLKRTRRLSTGIEVIYQNTDKLDKNFYINTKNYYLEGKDKVKTSKSGKISIESLIGQGTKLGIMYNFITFYPSTEPTDDLNTFSGFVGEIKRDDNNISFDLLLEHIEKILCKGDKTLFEYFMNWLTHTVQKPWIKTGVVPVLVGEQGCGKSFIFEQFFIPFVIGLKYCKTVDSIETVLEKHFNLSETLLLMFEEALFAGHKKEANTLKQRITGRQVIVNEKFKDIREVESYLNMVIISNQEHCLHVEVGDRRYLFMKCDSERKGNTEYFDKMSELFTPECGHKFYKYLMSRKLEKITTPPITELKEKIMDMSKDKISMFIDRVKEGDIESQTVAKLKGIEYYLFDGDTLLNKIGDGHLNFSTMKTKLLNNGWKHQHMRWKEFGVEKRGNRFIYPKPNITYIETDDFNTE